MLETMQIFAFVLIGVSLIWKIAALATLNNKNVDFAVRKKKYFILDILCYLFLIPGVVMYIYVWMQH